MTRTMGCWKAIFKRFVRKKNAECRFKSSDNICARCKSGYINPSFGMYCCIFNYNTNENIRIAKAIRYMKIR